MADEKNVAKGKEGFVTKCVNFFKNLPANVVPYSVVPIGYPRLDEKPKDKWKPEKVHYGRW